MRRTWIAIWVGLLAACDQQTSQNQPATNAPAPFPAKPAVPPLATGPDARTPLAEPKAPIDPKTAAGARAVIEHYCELLQAGRYREARRLWSGNSMTEAEFAAHWAGYGKVEACPIYEVGPLEGAAGSIYTTVSLQFFITQKGGYVVKLSGPLTLRRVNDVPGSTDEQRRWHIVKADLQPVD